MQKQDPIFLQNFNKLHQNRAELAAHLENPAVANFKRSVVDKYSDQAHFIYELIQNANDAKATKCEFILEDGRLLFKHNGTRLFSISNPDTEEEDGHNSLLGDLNAITSIAHSSKNEEQIGKFGVGFKSVFQYTEAPLVYDPNIFFRIEDFIIPVLLDSDFPDRKPNETVFVIPFDKRGLSPEEAYTQIEGRLQSLTYPTLFLQTLNEVEYVTSEQYGAYTKTVLNQFQKGFVTVQYLNLTHSSLEPEVTEKLWLFTETNKSGYKYSIGFFENEEGKLIPKKLPAYCFFQTREVTNLNFLINAPFLLTDSREGIKAGQKHNDDLIADIAVLAVKSLNIFKEIEQQDNRNLIHDTLLDIIPYSRVSLGLSNDMSKVSFAKIYGEIKYALTNDELIPIKDGYARKSEVFWASNTRLPKLFSDAQLSSIIGIDNVHWAFPHLGRDELTRSNSDLARFIEYFVTAFITEDAILTGRSRVSNETQKLVKGIEASFIEEQDDEWLKSFYLWISESNIRKKSVADREIFLNSERKAQKIYRGPNSLQLYFPSEKFDGFQFVHPLLCETPELQSMMQSYGVREPKLKDKIFEIIIPSFDSYSEEEKLKNSRLFFKFYDSYCNSNEKKLFVQAVSDLEFLKYRSGDHAISGFSKPGDTYYPDQLLQDYFQNDPSARFLDLSQFEKRDGSFDTDTVQKYLKELGVHFCVRIHPGNLTETEAKARNIPLPETYSKRKPLLYRDPYIEGLSRVLDEITKKRDPKLSVLLWQTLLGLIENKTNEKQSLVTALTGTCSQSSLKTPLRTFESTCLQSLRSLPWIVDSKGYWISPKNLLINELSETYPRPAQFMQELLRVLDIGEASSNGDHDRKNGSDADDPNLSKSQRKKIQMAEELEKLGITTELLDELLKIKEKEDRRKEQQKKRQEMAAEQKRTQDEQAKKDSDHITSSFPTNDSTQKNKNLNTQQKPPVTPRNSTSSSSEKNEKPHLERKPERSQKPKPGHSSVTVRTVRKYQNPGTGKRKPQSTRSRTVSDEKIVSKQSFSQRINQLNLANASEVHRMERCGKISEQLEESAKYSFGWTKLLLELEMAVTSSDAKGEREVSIAFSHVEKDPDSDRTLILKHSDRYIPSYLEDLSNIPLCLHTADKEIKLTIEVASVVSYSLRVKLEKTDKLNGLDFSNVQYATIDVKSPSFILRELSKKLNRLEFDDDYSFQENLPENISFIFGPPGTGKTTYLVNNIILPLLREEKEMKILVLTPTNKASDVILKKLIHSGQYEPEMADLIRLGSSTELTESEAERIRDNHFDLNSAGKSVTVSTIARFPYESFLASGFSQSMDSIDWDYVIFDEASMIPVYQILYPLFRLYPKKFCITGDPFQIEPTCSTDIGKGENIYTMVELNSFKNPTTVPRQYDVTLLKKQYRSIPSIGSVVSELTYDGVLEHNRSEDSRKPVRAHLGFEQNPITIIRFPVRKYESVYKSRTLNHRSSYHIYSAVFAFEFVRYLEGKITDLPTEDCLSIGVISPYKAQADLISKLLLSNKFSSRIQVQSGTIHSFQGDECDIIVCVLNTPPGISSSSQMFLNKKNILNVSISRVRDGLYLLIPDDETDNIDNLFLIHRMLEIVKSSSSWTEIQSSELEQLMFDDREFLENNIFSTGHQSVNVYGIPEKRYEVRSEDHALDIQIHNPNDESM